MDQSALSGQQSAVESQVSAVAIPEPEPKKEKKKKEKGKGGCCCCKKKDKKIVVHYDASTAPRTKLTQESQSSNNSPLEEYSVTAAKSAVPQQQGKLVKVKVKKPRSGHPPEGGAMDDTSQSAPAMIWSHARDLMKRMGRRGSTGEHNVGRRESNKTKFATTKISAPTGEGSDDQQEGVGCVQAAIQKRESVSKFTSTMPITQTVSNTQDVGEDLSATCMKTMTVIPAVQHGTQLDSAHDSFVKEQRRISMQNAAVASKMSNSKGSKIADLEKTGMKSFKQSGSLQKTASPIRRDSKKQASPLDINFKAAKAAAKAINTKS